MKKIILAAMLVSGSALAAPIPATVTSVLNGTIDVGTFVSAAPGQHQTQTSTGSITGTTTVNHATISSSIVGAASSVSSGTGVTYSSFLVNGLPSSAVTQGIVSTTIANHVIPVTTVISHGHD
jgi:hypothetical protein